jgi:hypothetical protein
MSTEYQCHFLLSTLQIYANGPVQSCFVFPANFQQFFNEHPLGVYNTTKGQNITGSHCVALTGWGRDADSGMDYWIIRNRCAVGPYPR